MVGRILERRENALNSIFVLSDVKFCASLLIKREMTLVKKTMHERVVSLLQTVSRLFQPTSKPFSCILIEIEVNQK